MDIPSHAVEDIPTLDMFAVRLLQLVRQLMEPRLRYDENDHLAFMALNFTSKQMEHLLSVRALIQSGGSRDAGLVARSMIEGLSLLQWAAREPSKWPFLWRVYAWIEDWRLMRENERRGETVEPSTKRDIDEQVQRYGHHFYSDDALRRQRAGKPLPADPYWRNWYGGKTVRAIFGEVAGEMPLYRRIYDETSKWIHWSPRGLGAAIRREDNEHTRYTLDSPNWAAMALAAGFQALIESALLLDSHLQLRFGQRLSALRDEYIRRLL